MDIKKSDLIGYIKNVTKQNIGKDLKKGKNADNALQTDLAKGANAINLDRLRGQVLGIQEELREIQTTITYNQTQIAYLDEQPGENWQKELRRFMSESFRQGGAENQDRLEKRLDHLQAKDEYVGAVKDEMRKLTGDLLKKEVQLQNIISTGLVDDVDEITSSKEIVKDILQSNDLFNKLRGDQIKNLLNS